jgi:hypothetical protein
MAAIDTYDAVVLRRGEAGRRSDAPSDYEVPPGGAPDADLIRGRALTVNGRKLTSVEFQPILNGNSSNEAAP